MWKEVVGRRRKGGRRREGGGRKEKDLEDDLER